MQITPRFLTLLVPFCIAFAGCATTYVEKSSEHLQISELVEESIPCVGPKMVVAVLPLGLSDRAARRYPHLLEKSVGMGVHNMVVEALYETGRFRFVEEKQEIIEDVLDRQWLGGAGFLQEGTAVQYGKMLGAQKVIYGEIYDYAEGGERIYGGVVKQDFQVRLGLQIRCVDVSTLEYMPASGVAVAEDISQATRTATIMASRKLIKRLF